jgi:hypothetical protein
VGNERAQGVNLRAIPRGTPIAIHRGMVSYFNAGPYSTIRVELEAMSPTGPYRLEIDHPAKRVVEYFDTPFAALVRHAEIEAALSGGVLPPTKIN